MAKKGLATDARMVNFGGEKLVCKGGVLEMGARMLKLAASKTEIIRGAPPGAFVAKKGDIS